MTVTTTANAVALIEALAREVARLQEEVRASKAHEFNFTGNGAQTAFPLNRGWKPFLVFVNGALMRQGSGEDYTLSFDGFTWSVTFAVAPGSVDVSIVARGA